MKKGNKILMIIVSILLTLVLITTSVLSGTLAKYTTSSSSSDKARVAKWGVVIEADYSAISSIEGVTVDTENDEMEISLGNFKMGPGDDFSNAIKFKIYGEAEVKLMVKITADVTYNLDDTNNFEVPKGIGGLTAKTTVVPFGFTFGALKADGTDAISVQYVANPCRSGTIEKTIAQGIADITDMDREKSSYIYAHKTFDPTDPIVLHPEGNANIDINDFYLGFKWPETYKFNGSDANYEEVVEWLLDNKNPTFEIKYIVTIEQLDS